MKWVLLTDPQGRGCWGHSVNNTGKLFSNVCMAESLKCDFYGSTWGKLQHSNVGTLFPFVITPPSFSPNPSKTIFLPACFSPPQYLMISPHPLNGHEFEQVPGDGKGQESLACCSPRGFKKSNMTECLNNNPTSFQLSTLCALPQAINKHDTSALHGNTCRILVMRGGWGDSHSMGFYLKHWGLIRRLHQAPLPLLDQGVPGAGGDTAPLKGLAWKRVGKDIWRERRERVQTGEIS